jgi:hypothetical protein
MRVARLRISLPRIVQLGLMAFLAASGPADAQQVTFKSLHSFNGGSDGLFPRAGAILDGSGAVYGITELGGANHSGTVFKLTPPTTQGGAWTESVVYSFCSQSNCTDGAQPFASLIFDASGALYGTTVAGGNPNRTCSPNGSGCGVVFKLTPPATSGGTWTESVLYSFNGGGTDGGSPDAGLIFDAAGALYGTTQNGAAPNCGGACGTAFKLTPPKSQGGAWTESVFTFAGNPGGAQPVAGLILDASGAVYGTTLRGGTHQNCPLGCGTVFKLIPPTTQGGAWTESVLYNFTGGSDGGSPGGGLVQDASGALYGTTGGGGSSCGGLSSGCGTVFKLTPPTSQGAAWTESVLYSFTGVGNDGFGPAAGLILDSSGALYGTTQFGGNSGCQGNGCGVVFKLTPPASPGGAWSESVLYNFTGGSDGAQPSAGVTMGASGVLYGTATVGGTGGTGGTVFELLPPSSPLVAAVLPASRSVQVGTAATAFATIINTGTTAAPSCAIAPTGALPLAFHYQTTNSSTNRVTGTADTPVAIAAGAAQSFVIASTPSAAFNPTNLAISFACAGVTPAPSVIGLNTLLLSASTTPTPDVVALAATLKNDGIVHVTGTPSRGVFAVATVDVGSGDTITAATSTGAATLPLTITICQTNPMTGACLQTPATTAATTISPGGTPTFGIFVSASGTVAFDPANSRIFVTFTDSTGAVRGETSVAVETQ